MSNQRKLLCAVYGLIAGVALIATWSQNLLYFQGQHPAGMGQYIADLKASGSARSFTVDIGLFLLAAVFLMVIEARRLNMGWTVWLYVLLGFGIAISVTFPLFLIARELKLAKAEPAGEPKLTASDWIGLTLVSAIVLGLVWHTLN